MCRDAEFWGVLFASWRGTGQFGAFAVTTHRNVAETLRRGEEGYGWSRRVGGDGEPGSRGDRGDGVSTGKALSVNGLRAVACCFQKQAYTLNVLSCSELGADVSKVHEIAIFGYGVTMVPCAS